MSRKLAFSEMAAGGSKFLHYLLRGGLLNINLEVTKRCNARCKFCDYWKEKPPVELQDYVAVVRKLNPLSVGLTGGEPLLRDDLADVIASLRKNCGFLYLSLITNGALLTVARGLELWEAGLDELSISLDYLDERHDRERGLNGLTGHILSVGPQLRAAGVNLCFNVVIKNGNYKEVPGIVRYAAERDIKVSLSTYNHWRVGNGAHRIKPDDLQDLRAMIHQVMEDNLRFGNVTTGEYYLERIAEFIEREGVPGCTAGVNWAQVTPDGMIKRCSDHPVSLHFTQWKTGFFERTDCDRCWYSCRGAAQEPFTWHRFVGMARDALDL